MNRVRTPSSPVKERGRDKEREGEIMRDRGRDKEREGEIKREREK
jgi:hypothetical protein